MRRRILIPFVAALVLVGAACVPERPTPPPDTTATSAPTTSTTTASTSTTTTSTATTTVPVPAPIWADDFTEGLSPEWRVYDNTYGSGGNILSGNSPDAVTVHDGLLELTMSRIPTHGLPFQGAIIGTRDTGRYFPRYGRFEFRAKLPPGGQGIWPAFWLRHRSGSSTGEVDVMEWFYSQRPTSTTATLHLDGRSNVSKHDVPFTQGDWHTWGVIIAPEGTAVRFTFTLDGIAYHTYLDTQHGWTSAPADSTWDIAVDAWLGGDWVGSPDGPLGVLGNGRCAIGGTPPNCVTTGLQLAQLPATMLLDWVHVSAL